jgi:hypothetical protein
MSLMIENVDDLRRLMKQLGVKVASAAELEQLLAGINASYNPDAARVRAVKLTCLTIPAVSFSVAGFVSLLLLTSTGNLGPFVDRHFWVAALAIVWGCASGATIISTILGFLTLLRRHPSARTPPAERPLPIPGQVLTESSSRFTLPRE